MAGDVIACALFPGDTVKFTTWNGTSDVLYPRLADTVGGAWEQRSLPWPPPVDVDESVSSVEIFSTYGGGFWWQGEATPTQVVKGISFQQDPYRADPCDIGAVFDGVPRWAACALGWRLRNEVTIRKNDRGSWCVYVDDELVSDHRTRDGAATSANQLIRAYRETS